MKKYIQEVGAFYSISIRNYLSNHLTDALHNGRTHSENKVQFWFGDKLNDDVNYTLYISKRNRKTNTSVDWIEALKEFEKWEFLLLFSYHFTSDILY